MSDPTSIPPSPLPIAPASGEIVPPASAAPMPAMAAAAVPPPSIAAPAARPIGAGVPPVRWLRWLGVVVALAAVWFIAYGAWIAPGGDGSGDLVQLGALLLIVVFVAIALLGPRISTRQLIRAMLGWMIVLLALSGAYGYRNDIVSIGGRILSAFAPGVPLAGRLAGDADAASVVVMRSRNGLFAVRAHVDDVPLTLLVDPGASFVTLTLADAAGVGIDPRTLNFSVSIRTANGLIKAAPITIDHLTVGTIEREHLSALVAPPDSLSESLLGMTFLETLASYAISGDRMVLNN